MLRFLFGLVFLSIWMSFDILEASSNSEVTDKADKWAPWRGLPVVYYTPETQTAIGGLVLFNYWPEPQGRISHTLVAAAMTQNQQRILSSNTKLYFHDTSQILTVHLFNSLYPNQYFGRSTSQHFDKGEPYKEQWSSLSSTWSQKFLWNWYWKVGGSWSDRQLLSWEENGHLIQELNKWNYPILKNCKLLHYGKTRFFR